MDGVGLLHRAWDAGLRVEAAGEMLKITGPKRAEPVVRLLAQHKAEVLAALTPNKNGTSLLAGTVHSSELRMVQWQTRLELSPTHRMGRLGKRVAPPSRPSLARLAMRWM